jgi:oligopeptidase B
MRYISLILAIVIAIAFTMHSCGRLTIPEPPDTEKIPVELVNHGDTRIDNYYWMRLSDEQKSSEDPDEQTRRVVDYLNRENDYKESVMGHTEKLQEELFSELTGRIKKDDSTVPYLDNGYYYFTRYYEEKEYPVYYRKKDAEGAEDELLLDVNKLAEGESYCQVTGLSVSPDNKILAYGIDLLSRRMYTIRFMDIETGELLDVKIENTTGSPVWASDSRTVFYVERDPGTLRSYKVMMTILGEEGAVLPIYTEEDETFSVYLSRTKSRKYILINSSQTLSTEVRIIDMDKPDQGFRILQPRMADHEYSADHLNGYFFIRTNSNGSTNFRLVKTSEQITGIDNWVDVVPHRENVLLQGFSLFDDYIALSERINGLNNIRVTDISGVSDHYIDFGEETYTAGLSVNPSPSTEILRYSYSSLTTPASVIDYNMKTREKTVLKEEEILGGFDKENYQSERLWVEAGDGTMVPVSLVYRKGFEKDGQAPLLLYAYGSYGSSTDPGFRSTIISLLDRGFVYAIAHVRGGSEMGRQWYEDGKLLNKKNTFTDFNDCARYLIENSYTNSDNLYAMGGSAGGLLIGAVINMEPELYKGVIAAVPFVDVVTTMLDPTIPLTTFEWDEWGDPREEEYYHYMLSYSPYDQVREIDYPNILVTTGFWDSQVQYWEPAKWVAKLRDMKTDDNILIMDCNMETGHGGASGRFERLKSTALQYAFVLDLAGLRR